MSYTVKEIYPTLQGEGFHTGRAAVFVRFAGCNLWTGRDEDRATAVCRFCDTEFVGTDGPGGGRFVTADELARAVAQTAADARGVTFVVLTGGEPMLQVDEPLIASLHDAGFEIAIETNGTLPVPRSIDWITVSPKAGAALVQQTGDELKLVYPQTGIEPDEFGHEGFTHYLLQPMDGPDLDANTAHAVAYCRAHPRWRLSLQTHKLLGLP